MNSNANGILEVEVRRLKIPIGDIVNENIQLIVTTSDVGVVKIFRASHYVTERVHGHAAHHYLWFNF